MAGTSEGNRAIETLGKIKESPVYGMVIAQFIATFLASASFLVFDRVAALSALMAGLVCLIPGGFVLAMSLRPIEPGGTGISNVIRGEAGKFALSIMLFAMVFVLIKPLDPVAFFATFIVLQLCAGIAPWMKARRRLKPH
ncbi:MAG: ATP synthase subunit I [Pseudomonadales bacterium]|nr:ATP synthase subunit I [Pseudomonadales bacterium]MBO6656506.1 ATP synthase subunit I [Pseudomonadales bacterium]